MEVWRRCGAPTLQVSDSIPRATLSPSVEQLGDTDLMQCIQSGQTHLFAELVRRYERALRHLARTRLGRDDWAEEVVQETFLAAFKSRHTYNADYALRTWLWTILINQCRGYQRRRARDHVQDTATGENGFPPPESTWAGQLSCGRPAPLDQLLAKERRERLDALLTRLPAAQAGALRLRFFGGLKFEEIAQAMECSLSSAKHRVRCGLLRMSQWMAEQADREAASERGADDHLGEPAGTTPQRVTREMTSHSGGVHPVRE